MKSEEQSIQEIKTKPEKKEEGFCGRCAQAFCVNPYNEMYYCDALKTTKCGEESCELFERRGKAE